MAAFAAVLIVVALVVTTGCEETAGGFSETGVSVDVDSLSKHKKHKAPSAPKTRTGGRR